MSSTASRLSTVGFFKLPNYPLGVSTTLKDTSYVDLNLTQRTAPLR